MLLDQAAESFQKFAYSEVIPHIPFFQYRIISGASCHDRMIDIQAACRQNDHRAVLPAGIDDIQVFHCPLLMCVGHSVICPFLFDICSCAYPEMLEQIRECSRRVYRIAAGQAPRCEKEAESIPMIAY